MSRLALLLVACAPALPLDAPDWTTAQEAASILGIPIEPGHVVTITLSPVAQTTDRKGCRRSLETPNDAPLMAHELGHVLGLDHVLDPANVMHAYVGRDTTQVTDHQHETMSATIERLARCP